MLKIFQVDAFADQLFTGNPAMVCLIETESGDYDSQWMQLLAAEMNLSETAFLIKKAEGHYHLRWFTPATEVKLCGHATLASAHVLWTEVGVPTDMSLSFDTLSGCLDVHYNQGLITLDFPVAPLIESKMNQSLKTKIEGVVSCDYLGLYQSGDNLIIELVNEDEVAALQPNFEHLSALPIDCLIVTANSNQYDFICRVFAPRLGINEDPVTGSAYCALTPFWSKKLGKNRLNARQISERGGDLSLVLKADRVEISGTAVTVLKGEIV